MLEDPDDCGLDDESGVVCEFDDSDVDHLLDDEHLRHVGHSRHRGHGESQSEEECGEQEREHCYDSPAFVRREVMSVRGSLSKDLLEY